MIYKIIIICKISYIKYHIKRHLMKNVNIFGTFIRKILGTLWWKKIEVGGTNIVQMFSVSFAKTFAFSRKKIAFSSKYICILSQNFCVLSQRYLPFLAKPVEFGQTLPVYFTACSGSVCSQWSGSYHFILNLDSNKEIRQCLVQVFGTL